MNKIMYILPLLTLVILGYLVVDKSMERSGKRLISQPIPHFELWEFSFIGTKNTITPQDLPKKVIMINMFASWCPTCLIEHPQLMVLAQKHKLPIYGIAYNDKEEELSKWLIRRGNPYERIALAPKIYKFDDWDVRGTPESFLIDARGIIRYHHKGPITRKHMYEVILPIIRKIEQ